jgi:Domain of unknown function (DUF4431)
MRRGKTRTLALIVMGRACTCAIVLGLSVGPLSTAFADCLPHEPASVLLMGKLQRRTYPGPPNYESIAKGDAPETGFYLLLPKAVCTAGDDFVDPQKDVRLVQLVLTKQGYEQLRPYLGRSVHLRGTLFGAHTGHHHAPVLLQFERMANER